MRTLLGEVQGIDWMDGAVMNCKWKGPRLRDVLLKAGLKEIKDRHVAFSCYQVECQDDGWYGGSIGLERCMSADSDVILALEVSFPQDKYLSKSTLLCVFTDHANSLE